MKPLQVLVRDVVAPTLRERGFSRSAGTFRRTSEAGVVVVEVSGRGGIGLTDLDFSVSAGFVTTEDLEPDVPAGKVRLALGAVTWQDVVRDPAVATPMDQRWVFTSDNTAALACVEAVLGQAADDVVRRLETWPASEPDSFSRPRVLDPSLEPGERPEYGAFLAQARASVAAAWPDVVPPSWPPYRGP